MDRNRFPAARRLDALKRAAADSVATILANHADGEYRDRLIAEHGNWRNRRKWSTMPRGAWQAPEDVKRHDERAYYIDSLDALGWRNLGRADEVSEAAGSRTVDHSGWYTDSESQSETVSGYVLQIPARGGKPQYVAGLASTAWDGATVYPLDRYDEPLDAARAADGYAERTAEQEREYQDAWQAGNRWADLGEAIAAARCAALEILKERRAVKLPPAMCGAVRARVESLLEEISEAREKRRELATGYWNADAFNDAAGKAVI